MWFILQFIVIGFAVLVVLDLIIGWPFEIKNTNKGEGDEN